MALKKIKVNEIDEKSAPVAGDYALVSDSENDGKLALIPFSGITGGATAIDHLAPLESPTFTGTPTAPTAAKGTNTTQIATTAHVYANYKQTCSYTQGGGKTIDPAEPGKLYSFTGAGTLVLPNASTVPDGTIIDVFCQSHASTVTITSATRLIGVAGASSYTFSLSGYGNTVRFQSIFAEGSGYYWMILFDPELAIARKASGSLLTEGTPSGPTATGTKGMARFDADYFYVCTATNTWVRFAKDGSWT